ncbi:unnamed protein product [Ceutorhynchus assimilis]|uniref:Transposase IS30-like HTH domain-containing protein n=1 Tax=Ceutorhynchus assimilis TaxID=467358 RepID=A0A9N9MWJ3_9CUCU|nr:unnamed protein product [Ceutorhynchus assimilis]
MRRLTREERDNCLRLLHEGKTQQEIADFYNVHQSRISRLQTRFRITGDHNYQYGAGRGNHLAIPNNQNIRTKEIEKTTKYEQLTIEILKVWQLEKVEIIPIIVFSMGLVPKSLKINLGKLNLHDKISADMQKAVVIDAVSKLTACVVSSQEDQAVNSIISKKEKINHESLKTNKQNGIISDSTAGACKRTSRRKRCR